MKSFDSRTKNGENSISQWASKGWLQRFKKLRYPASVSIQVKPKTPVYHGPLTGFYQNCRGIRSKLTNFKCNVSAFNYDFIVLTETWLNDCISDCELGLVNYIIYRCDRSNFTNTSLKGGGILIGVRKDLTSYPISILESNVEQLFVRISTGSLKIIVSGVYIPHSSSPFIYELHIKSVESIIRQFPNHIYIFCDDYNLPGIIWENDVNGLVYFYSTPISAHCIPETFASHSFFQSNSILNKTNSFLDLKSDESIVPIDLYHPALYLFVPFNTPITYCERDHSFFNFRKANYTNIRSFIASFD
ncbi:hypothetical protein AGLY_003467 [Aphis glycines]|uniref:Uncharacterized protein n=1 Tax=Aphis glycines TaxID=307491 RepID=A0A6G0U0M8_APHGL|nr:hypothetical protein AGLY_003467 [Aphis glycines]